VIKEITVNDLRIVVGQTYTYQHDPYYLEGVTKGDLGDHDGQTLEVIGIPDEAMVRVRFRDGFVVVIPPEGLMMKWTYKDGERPDGVCYDCGLKYGELPDVTVSDELWEKINPTEHKGAGLLCPNCMVRRLAKVCLSNVVMWVRLG